jgi:hypothetical protein
MSVDAHLPLMGRRIAALSLLAMLSFFIAFGTPDGVAAATANKSLTQAQKLSKALKACKKQPKRKRAACIKRAKKKYRPHHALTPASAPSAPLTSSGTPAPAGAPGPAPAAPTPGPVAPAPPTLAQVQQQLCEHHCAQGKIENVAILERGVPRLGTGVSQQRGGDNVPADTWIFPLVVGYDELVSIGHYAPCPPEEPFCPPTWVTETETYHWTEKENAQFAANATWAFFYISASAVCEPAIASCPT